ncbi:MAG: TlpA family protein disulfide reductase [Fidelibacterota bacterium]|nr:MAG: TlpA family protein disulfide reductase [Candidatus Neomarinimicrobiota bacterium]
MLMRNKTMITVITAAVILVSSALAFTIQQGQEPKEKLSLAPDFTLRSLDGERIKLSSLRGKLVLLNFWATWCGPCRREIPDLNRIYESYRDRGVVILGVSWDELQVEQIKKFVTNYKVTYPVLHGTQSELSQVGRAYAWQGYLPTTYLIDREGYVRDVYIGARSERFFLKGIEPLL